MVTKASHRHNTVELIKTKYLLLSITEPTVSVLDSNKSYDLRVSPMAGACEKRKSASATPVSSKYVLTGLVRSCKATKPKNAFLENHNTDKY